MNKFVFFLFYCFTFFAQAQSVLLGHNLGVTTLTPPAKTISIGSYLASYSPTDNLLIGTSTWMMWGYNSYNLVTRYSHDVESSPLVRQLSVQLAYLKSGEFGPDVYRQEVAMAWFTSRSDVNPHYSLYTTFNYMYFFDETLPFSLRREPFNDEKYQLTITTLHNLRFNENWAINLEFGVLGIKARYPQVHSGFSIAYTRASYLIQLGVSVTATPYNFERMYEAHKEETSKKYYDASAHPEIQLQWFF